MMKSMISMRPWPERMLAKTKGRDPSILRASQSITLSEAPTNGARSTLLKTRRSECVIPARPCAGSCRRRDVDDVDVEVGKLGREDRGKIVAAGLDQDKIEAGGSGCGGRRPRQG